MLGHSREKIGPAVVELWEAPCVSSGNVRPMSGIKICGAGLTLLLSHPGVRSHLEWLELNRDIPEFAFAWDDGRRTIYAPFATPKDWRRRLAELAKIGISQTKYCLPGAAVEKIAGPIETRE
jgi:hypothetical protein